MNKHWSSIMKILNKLSVSGRTILTLDCEILEISATKVRVDGKEYDFDIAYGMKNAIGIKAESVISDTVEFV